MGNKNIYIRNMRSHLTIKKKKLTKKNLEKSQKWAHTYPKRQ